MKWLKQGSVQGCCSTSLLLGMGLESPMGGVCKEREVVFQVTGFLGETPLRLSRKMWQEGVAEEPVGTADTFTRWFRYPACLVSIVVTNSARRHRAALFTRPPRGFSGQLTPRDLSGSRCIVCKILPNLKMQTEEKNVKQLLNYICVNSTSELLFEIY